MRGKKDLSDNEISDIWIAAYGASFVAETTLAMKRSDNSLDDDAWREIGHASCCVASMAVDMADGAIKRIKKESAEWDREEEMKGRDDAT